MRNFTKKNYKKFIMMILTLVIVLINTLPASVMAEANIISYISGTEEIRAGDTITITYSISGTGLFGINGTIGYDYSKLTYVSSDTLIGGSWNGSYNNTASKGVKFLLTDSAQTNPINSYTDVFSMTFSVNESLAIGEVVDITAKDVEASAGTGLLTASNVPYSKTVLAPKSTNNYLSSLGVSEGSISPAFDKNTTEYSITVPYTTSNLTVSAAAEDAKSEVSIGSGSLSAGANRISITVTAESGATKTYYINATRQADTSDIILSTPSELKWDSSKASKASWSAVSNASGYIIRLYKDGSAIGSDITGITGTSYDFQSMITTSGSYTFKVIAVGTSGTRYKNSPQSAASPAYNYTVPVNAIVLGTPTNLKWDTTTKTKATWDVVSNASSYSIRLYKDNIAISSEILGINATSYNFALLITSSGSYTYKVTAIGNGSTYTNGAQSAASEVYNHTVSASAIVLNAPTSVMWDTTTDRKATWAPVANASSYTLTLYKDGVVTESVFNGIQDTFYDLQSEISSLGVYTYTVTAVGDGINYTDSRPSAMSNEFSYDVSIYKNQTISDSKSGVSATGHISEGATISIIEMNSSTTEYSLLMVNRYAVLNCYNVSINGKYEGTIKLTFNIGEKYNGKTITIRHMKANNTIESLTAVVSDGIITVSISEFSPFMLLINEADLIGDKKSNVTALIWVGLFVVVAGAGVSYYFIRKSRKLK